MTHKTLQTVLVASLVLLAGCVGGLSGSPTTAPGGTDDGAGSIDGGAGTVAFYVSDQPNAIEDFEHLNVTISQVGFQQAGDGQSDDNESAADEPETETDSDDFENETDADELETETDSDDFENETDAAEPETETNSDDFENETDADEPEADDDDRESGGWVRHDVDNRTVDLTELVGDNATMLAEFDVPNGSYSKVFVHVSEVQATLENGETVNVKLPSEKLQLNKPFEIGDGESVDFVFDIAVHKAGNSGKYILRPVIGESGTDVPIQRIDDDDDGDVENALNASFVGEVSPGGNATVEVRMVGEPVANATVTVNDEQSGVTNADGHLTFAVPDGEDLEVEIRHDDAEAELEREFEGEDGPGNTARTPTAT